jgi:hypothetical protein
VAPKGIDDGAVVVWALRAGRHDRGFDRRLPKQGSLRGKSILPNFRPLSISVLLQLFSFLIGLLSLCFLLLIHSLVIGLIGHRDFLLIVCKGLDTGYPGTFDYSRRTRRRMMAKTPPQFSLGGVACPRLGDGSAWACLAEQFACSRKGREHGTRLAAKIENWRTGG